MMPSGRRQRGAPGTRSSTIWNVAQYGGSRVVTFVSTLVLARLLSPTDFGVVAVALLAINLFDRFKDLGVGPALVQDRRPWARLAPTGMVMTGVTALVVTAACALGAEQIASALSPDAAGSVAPLIRALSLFLLLTGLAVLPDAALRRLLRFRERAVPELAGSVVKAVVSIWMAMRGYGAWALVWGQIAASAVTLVLYWVIYPTHKNELDEPIEGSTAPDRGHWSGDVATSLVRYGGSLTIVALLSLVLDNIDYFVIGRRLGAEQLGYYTMAFRLPEMLVIGVCIVIGQVLFASFSRVQDDLPTLQEHYLRAVALVAAVTVPLGVGLAAAAGPVVDVILGPQYSESIPLLRILGLYAVVFSLSFHSGEVYKATGRTTLMIVVALTQIAVFIPVLWWAAGHSTQAVAWAFLAGHTLYLGVRLAIITRVISLPIGRQLGAIVAPLAAAAVMAALVHGAIVLSSGLPALLQLVVAVSVGVAAYAGALAVVRPELFRLLLRRGEVA